MAQATTTKTILRKTRGRPPDPARRSAKLQRMLEAGLELFVQKGYDSVSIEEISRTAGQSKGAFYWYFRDKEDFLRRVLEIETAQFELVLGRFVRAAFAGDEPLAADRQRVAQVFRLMVHLQYGAHAAIRALGAEASAQCLASGRAAIARHSRELALAAGWTPERLARFDFGAWSACCLACLQGLSLPALPSPEPLMDTRRIAHALREVFVQPLVSAT